MVAGAALAAIRRGIQVSEPRDGRCPWSQQGLRQPYPHAPPLPILLLLAPLRSLCCNQQLGGEPYSVSGRET